jgi:hypothetical protein
MIPVVTVQDIREYFINQLKLENYVTDKTGCKMLELPGASFLATEPSIFGTVNEEYVSREIQWYDVSISKRKRHSTSSSSNLETGGYARWFHQLKLWLVHLLWREL